MRHYRVTILVDVEADYANIEDFTEEEVRLFNDANKGEIQVIDILESKLLDMEVKDEIQS